MMVCTFTVADRLYGVPVDRVQEVIRRQPCTPVPLAGSHVAGLVNLRGSVVCAIDLRSRLGLPAQASPVSVVVRHQAGVAALFVDQISDVLDVPDAEFEPAPSTVPARDRELMHGVFKRTGRLLCVLDVDRVVRG